MKATISVYLRIEQIKKNSSVGFYLRFTKDRRKVDIALGQGLFPNSEISRDKLIRLTKEERYSSYNWDREKSKITKGERNFNELNQFLNKEKQRAIDIILSFQLQDKVLTRDVFKKEFSRKNNIKLKAGEYFLKQSEERKHLYSKETYRSYKSILTKFSSFSKQRTLKEINPDFLESYENFMIESVENGGRSNDKATISNNFKVLKTYINIAIKNGDLPKMMNPFDEFLIKKVKTKSDRSFLEPNEIEKLEQLLCNYEPTIKQIHLVSSEEWIERRNNNIITPSEYNVLRCFLFACYTGLRYTDVKGITYDCIKKRLVNEDKSDQLNERIFIELDMHKTGFTVRIPLMEKALQLLGNIKNDGNIFNVISNQKTNEKLKNVLAMTGIKKKITFHCSRHTFASLALLYGLPQKFVQQVLGHQDLRTTEIYTHTTDNYLFTHIDAMDKKLGSPKSKKKKNSELLSKLIDLDSEKLNKLLAIAELMG